MHNSLTGYIILPSSVTVCPGVFANECSPPHGIERDDANVRKLGGVFLVANAMYLLPIIGLRHRPRR